MALLLVMMALILSTTLAYSFVAAQAPSIAISRNIREHSRARFVAESGVELALAYIEATDTWRADQTSGTWVTNEPFGDGTFTIVGEDGVDADDDGTISIPAEGDGNLADDDEDPLTLTVTGNVNGVTHRVRLVLSVQSAEGKLYWTDKNTKKLHRANLDGSNEEVLVSGVDDPMGVAADGTGGKVYWADNDTKKIHRANLDGSDDENLISGVDDPMGIAVDPGGGKLYWADKDTKKIHRANLDGSGKENLVSGVDDPAGVAVGGGKIYWADKDTKKIHRANHDGSGKENLVSGVDDPKGIAVDADGGKIYWADKNTKKIHRANLDGSGQESLIDNVQDPTGVAVDTAVGGGGEGTLYDYANRVPGANIFAYDGSPSTKIPSDPYSPSSELSSGEYGDIQMDDGAYHDIASSSNNTYPQKRFVIVIDEAEEDVASIEVSWTGYNNNQNPGRTDGAEWHIWNYTTSSYVKLDDIVGSTSETTLTGTIDTAVADYLGGASDNTITLLAVSVDRKTGQNNRLYTDYVSVQITSSGGSGGGAATGYAFDWR